MALNVEQPAQEHTFTVGMDATPPETTIHSTPEDPSSTVTAVFTFSASGPEITFECALDAEPFESCESPHMIEELAPGEHTFLVRAVDLFGNMDPKPASY